MQDEITYRPFLSSSAGAQVRNQYTRSRSSSGFSLLELLLVVTISLILGAIAIPATQSAMASYQLSAAVDAVTGAIQGTRFQAIMHGYPYQVAIDATHNTIQVLNEAPPATSYTATGASVPISSVPVVVSASTTLQFKSNGSVSAGIGQMSFTVSYNGTTKTVTVSNYGATTVQ